MLNLNVNVDVDLNRTKLPIFFDGKNECVVCGEVGTLDFIDKFGNRHNDEIRAFDHIMCRKCKTIYSILWQRLKDNPAKMYPSAVEPNIGKDFTNMINSDIKNKGTKEFIN